VFAVSVELGREVSRVENAKLCDVRSDGKLVLIMQIDKAVFWDPWKGRVKKEDEN
jgi:hypothetical protein